MALTCLYYVVLNDYGLNDFGLNDYRLNDMLPKRFAKRVNVAVTKTYF